MYNKFSVEVDSNTPLLRRRRFAKTTAAIFIYLGFHVPAEVFLWKTCLSLWDNAAITDSHGYSIMIMAAVIGLGHDIVCLFVWPVFLMYGVKSKMRYMVMYQLLGELFGKLFAVVALVSLARSGRFSCTEDQGIALFAGILFTGAATIILIEVEQVKNDCAT